MREIIYFKQITVYVLCTAQNYLKISLFYGAKRDGPFKIISFVFGYFAAENAYNYVFL
jgi:hypothetical protein